jgi:tryptophanyl-tRNA synthetase
MSAVTDSGSEVKFDPENKPGISNLLTIYAALKDTTPEEAEKQFVNSRYGDFKKAVADAVEEELAPFKAKYEEIIANKSYVSVLQEGAKKASLIADKTLHRVQKAVGLLQIDE